MILVGHVLMAWMLVVGVRVAENAAVNGEMDSDNCNSNNTQYLEIGGLGTVTYTFPYGAVYAISWFNSTDYRSDDPIMQYQQGHKSGRGYNSGEYDIFPNGSLIIEEVSQQHEGIFTALIFSPEETESIILPYCVRVVPKLTATDSQSNTVEEISSTAETPSYRTEHGQVLSPSTTDNPSDPDQESKNKGLIIGVIVCIIVVIVVCFIVCICCWCKRTTRNPNAQPPDSYAPVTTADDTAV